MAENYQIKLGDCIFCIIKKHGLLPETVWQHANNSSLRQSRQNLKLLQINDVVFIPDIRTKEVKEPTNQVHKFQLKGEKHQHWIEIELIGEDDKPIPNEKFKLIMSDGSEKEGNLDENGWARLEVSSKADCEVIFPELDEEAWKYIERSGAKKQSS